MTQFCNQSSGTWLPSSGCVYERRLIAAVISLLHLYFIKIWCCFDKYEAYLKGSNIQVLSGTQVQLPLKSMDMIGKLLDYQQMQLKEKLLIL